MVSNSRSNSKSPPSSSKMTIVTFLNARLCRDGHLSEGAKLVIDTSTGRIVGEIDLQAGTTIDMKKAIIAPGFLELQTNGLRGFHFTHFHDEEGYVDSLNHIAKYLPRTGVTAFYPTIPTVSSDHFKKVLPHFKPRNIPSSAAILGAHAEGPYLHPSKKGAHNAALFQPPSTPIQAVYGEEGVAAIKITTLAPENPGSTDLIESLTQENIIVSLGHSSATYTQGLSALASGAKCLTHTLNAMTPLHHRDPGLAGLITMPPSSSSSSLESPYFTLIPDAHHLHPAIATLLFRSNPEKCIFITDSIELAGLPDGTYPGHAQIPYNQTKLGSRVVIEGTETLIGGCASLSECVRNMMEWSDCGVAEAVRCVTENVARLMGLDGERGVLEVGRRADFVVLSDEGEVLQTWVGGVKVWDAEIAAEEEGDGGR